jgi:hypothetical protein
MNYKMEVKMRKFKWFYFIIILLVSFSFVLSIMAQEKKESESGYTIKPGDTLWDISSKFLKNPFLWPKLWERNPYITNPHWIYPGQSIRLSPDEVKKEEPKIEEPKKVVVEEKPKEIINEPVVMKEPVVVKEPEVKKEEPSPLETKPEVVIEAKEVKSKPVDFPEVRSAGFMSDIDYKGLGIILDNREGKNLMSEGDIVYLAFGSSESILIGNKYTIFRPSEIVRLPFTEKRVARKYNITGNIQIIDQYGSFYTAKVIEAFEAILKGDMIRPYLKDGMVVEDKKQ